MPEQPAIPEVVDVALRSANDVGVGVGERVEHLDQAALLGDEDAAVVANLTTVGLSSPLKTTESWNPVGRVAACAGVGTTAAKMPVANTSSRLGVGSAPFGRGG